MRKQKGIPYRNKLQGLLEREIVRAHDDFVCLACERISVEPEKMDELAESVRA